MSDKSPQTPVMHMLTPTFGVKLDVCVCGHHFKQQYRNTGTLKAPVAPLLRLIIFRGSYQILYFHHSALKAELRKKSIYFKKLSLTESWFEINCFFIRCFSFLYSCRYLLYYLKQILWGNNEKLKPQAVMLGVSVGSRYMWPCIYVTVRHCYFLHGVHGAGNDVLWIMYYFLFPPGGFRKQALKTHYISVYEVYAEQCKFHVNQMFVTQDLLPVASRWRNNFD